MKYTIKKGELIKKKSNMTPATSGFLSFGWCS